jgi:hypothetical protein
MAANSQLPYRLGRKARFGFAAVCGLALMTAPVFGQYFGPSNGGFDSYFSPFSAPRYRAPVERPVDYSRAPSPKKLDTQPSGGSVLVLGDSMADWLAYGLEDALGDPPDLAVVRKNRASSGLIRYDSRNENQDWAQVIREAIAATKPKYVVMMLGLNDRVSIRDRVSVVTTPPAGSKASVPAAATAKPATPERPDAKADIKPEAKPDAKADAKADASDAEQAPPDQPAAAAPEPQHKGSGTTTTTTYHVYEFRSEEWALSYSKRIDSTIAALKSAGVPVFWVGLPSIRGPKSTSDIQYLDDLYRASAEKAGVSYIDIWDGFVDDNGRFIVQGADFEGQIRKLRTGDGVHFTKAGARKLAHYLEREIRRVMTPGGELVALPSSEPVAAPAAPAKPSGPAARPLAGPVVPLTASAPAGQELIGAKDAGAPSGPKFVTRALVNGEAVAPPAGRADDFQWPRRAVAPVGADPIVATTTEPIPVMKPAPQTTVAAPNSESRPVAAASSAPRRTTARVQPQYPQPQYQPPPRNSFFSFFR